MRGRAAAAMQAPTLDWIVWRHVNRLPSETGVVSGRDVEMPETGELAVVEAFQQQQNSAIDVLAQKVDSVLGNLGGFKFSGDFRFRADMQVSLVNDGPVTLLIEVTH